MVVTVPLGDTIDVTFQNKAKGVPHNVEFIDFTTNVPGGALAQPAFKGAETPQRRFPVGGRGTGNWRRQRRWPGNGGGGFGAPGAQKPETFSFVANKSGKYMFMCAIARHALAGMWDTFVVSSSGDHGNSHVLYPFYGRSHERGGSPFGRGSPSLLTVRAAFAAPADSPSSESLEAPPTLNDAGQEERPSWRH